MDRLSGTKALRVLVVGLVLAVAAAALPGGAVADHSWGSYHWGRTSNPFSLKLGSNLSGAWPGHLSIASTDWTASDVLDTTVVRGGTSAKRCSPTSGRVEVCNAAYGRTGWLGIAQVWTSGGHIVQGTAKMNDTYHNSPPYNTDAWRQFVMCQEVGHTFGLGHVNETFDDPNTGSCMDYTNDPSRNDGAGNHLHPNAHDYAQLASIYGHTDSKSTYDASAVRTAGLSGVEISNPAGPERGGVSVFVTDLGAGKEVVTFVIWADANLIAAAHANPRAPIADVTTDEDGYPVDGGDGHDHDAEDHAEAGLAAGSTVVTVDSVNLRAAPSRQADVVTELAAGTTLTVTGPAEESQGLLWVPVVTAEGLTGYVAAEYLLGT